MALKGWHQTLRRANLVFCMTEPHARAVQSQYPNLKSLPLPVIVEPPSVPARPNLWTETKRPTVLLFAANLLPHKHPEVFCETVRLLRERGFHIQGILLGDGPERENLETWQREHQMEEHIILKGKVPHEMVWKHMREADFLVSTSIGEPYGRSIVEAMALGTPTVCHRSGGPADFIEHACSSLLVGELAAPAYAAALTPYLENPAKWTELSAGALRTAAAWRADAVLEHVENALYQVTGGRA
jgi:glycosyltransferase involved in cell wall biosynthesis